MAGEKLIKRAPISDIIWLFVGTRLLLVMCTYFGFILLPVPPHVYPSTPVNVTALLTSWNRWDAANYTRIAQFSYQSIKDTAFFPLFPKLIWGIAFLFGNQGYIAIGMILSNAAFLGALFVLYQIATDALGNKVARRTLLYLCIFPTAFFFFAAYNESLFLLLTASAILAMRRQKWWLAGVLGLFAALTRSAAMWLVIPYVIELWISQEGISVTRLNWLLKLLPVLLIPLGTAIYCTYCWIKFGDPLAFATAQIYWARHLSWPWLGTWLALVDLFWAQPFGSFYEAHTLLDISATFGFIILAILGWRKLRLSYNIWLVLLLAYMLISPATTQHDALQSNQRFVLEMFPAFIILASLGVKHQRLHQALLLFFPTLQAVMVVLFITNHWIV